MMIDCGDMTVPPEWHVDERAAPGFMRVYHVQDGDVVYTGEHGQKRLERGKAYLFPSAAPFSIAHDPAHPLRCTYLHWDIFPILARELVELPLEPGGLVEKLFAVLQTAIRQESLGIVASLSDALELYCREKGLLQMPVTELSAPLLYIAQHIGRGPISVAELSAQTGYNPQYFIRLFRQSVGMTPHQYITNYRLNESVKLLRKRELTVTQVAEQVGYADVKAFGRAFRGRYGISATQFRKLDLQVP